MSDLQKTIRILLVEDDPERIKLMQAWAPQTVRLISATSGGRALGIIERDRGVVYQGIMLDHDLDRQALLQSDFSVSGTAVVGSIIRNISPEVPVLIHSMNFGCAAVMTRRLEQAGFDVTRIPMSMMNKDDFLEWIEKVRENWSEA